MTTRNEWPYFVIGGAVTLTLAVIAGLALDQPKVCWDVGTKEL
jgi:hypothetical protein